MLEVSVPQNLVDDLRNAFLKEIAEKNTDFAHPADIERVKTNDFWLKRFLMHHDLNHKLALDMLLETVQWRKENNVNDISESNIRMDYIVEGGVFCRGRDKDGHRLFIFNCRKHTKGTKNLDELKRCVIYWFERLEREEKGKGITIFFDLEGCGLSNMDLDFIRYLINLFKMYYPYFLNYIIIYEMAWILNAAFKLIKSWLPPKAVERIKSIKKPEIGNWVPLKNALKCWGGEDDYVFSFEPEVVETVAINNNASNRKVHFADPSPMSESPGPTGDKENDASSNKLLSVNPPNIITFIKDGSDLVSTLELQNIDPTTNISYKMKTTSPEKFRVKPSAGCLAPGEKTIISVTLLQGFQLRGLSKDKFLLMSMPVDSTELSHQALGDLWKNVSNKNVSQHRLRCAQSEEINKNGNAVMVGNLQDADDSHFKQLSGNIATLMDCQAKLHKAVNQTQLMQWILIGVTVLFSVVIIYIVKSEVQSINTTNTCYHSSAP